MIITLNNFGNNLAKTSEWFIQYFKPMYFQKYQVEAYLNFMLYICGTGFSQ